MADTVSFTTLPGRELTIDFDNKQISFVADHEKIPSSAPNYDYLPWVTVNFSDITGIEMTHSGFLRAPGCYFIINGKRLTTPADLAPLEVCHIFVNKAQDKELTNVLERIVSECNLPPIKAHNEISAPRVDYDDFLADEKESSLTVVCEPKRSKKKEAQEKEARQNKEYRKRCNVCGKVFCYTQKEFDDSINNALIGGLSAIGTIANAVGGTMYGAVEMNKMSDRQMDKVRDFSKCPYCNSSDLTDITEEEFNQSSSSNTTPQATVSAADEIKKFKELLDMGVITQEEFDAKKKQLLGL